MDKTHVAQQRFDLRDIAGHDGLAHHGRKYRRRELEQLRLGIKAQSLYEGLVVRNIKPLVSRQFAAKRCFHHLSFSRGVPFGFRENVGEFRQSSLGGHVVAQCHTCGLDFRLKITVLVRVCMHGISVAAYIRATYQRRRAAFRTRTYP